MQTEQPWSEFAGLRLQEVHYPLVAKNKMQALFQDNFSIFLCIA